MRINDLSQSKTAILSDHWLAHPEDREKIAASFNTTIYNVERYLQFFRHFDTKRAEQERDDLLNFFSDEPQPDTVPAIKDTLPEPVPASVTRAMPRYTLPVTTSGDNVVITSDWHLPALNWPLWYAAVFVARAIEASHVFVIGDIQDNGQPGLSPWPAIWPVPVPTGDDCIDQAISLTGYIHEQTGAEVVITGGNHDVWGDRATGGQYWINRQLRASGVTVSRYHYCYHDTSRGRWYLTHPKNYSRALLGVPAQHRDRVECHVACAHTHGLGLGVRNGRWIAEAGGLFDPSQMQYLNVAHSTAPMPTPGFMYLRRGTPYLVNENSDLTDVLGPLYDEYVAQLASLEVQAGQGAAA